MGKDNVNRSRYTVHEIRYHFVWIPKRRKKVLVGEVAKRLREICIEVASENNWKILELAIQPDHVHLFVETTPREAPYQIARAFKGRSSRILRSEFPELLKLPSLWSHSYFCRSVGHVSRKTIERYIREQSS